MVTIIIFSILGGLLLITAIWFVATYNKFVSLKNGIEEAFSTMDVYLKKRYDLIPNLINITKNYAKHEKETFEKVVAARSLAMSAKTVEERVAAENAITGTLKTLFALSENYPALKADANFMKLHNSLETMEGDIANSRKYYNGVVKQFNTKRERFPSNLIAGMFKFEKRTLFEIENTEERSNVKVELD